ncbi:hypothetical protein TYRP_011702, partial [Tyrophagus putrescentiae]
LCPSPVETADRSDRPGDATLFDYLPLVDLQHIDEVHGDSGWCQLKIDALHRRPALVIGRQQADLALIEVVARYQGCSFELLWLIREEEENQDQNNETAAAVLRGRSSLLFHQNTLYTGATGHLGPRTNVVISEHYASHSLTSLSLVLPRRGRVSELVELTLLLEHPNLRRQLRQLTVLFWADWCGESRESADQDFKDAFRAVFVALNQLVGLERLTLNLRRLTPYDLSYWPQWQNLVLMKELPNQLIEGIVHRSLLESPRIRNLQRALQRALGQDGQEQEEQELPLLPPQPFHLSAELLRQLRHLSVRTWGFARSGDGSEKPLLFQRIFTTMPGVHLRNQLGPLGATDQWDDFLTLGLYFPNVQRFPLAVNRQSPPPPPCRLEELYIGNSISLARALGGEEEEEEEEEAGDESMDESSENEEEEEEEGEEMEAIVRRLRRQLNADQREERRQRRIGQILHDLHILRLEQQGGQQWELQEQQPLPSLAQHFAALLDADRLAAATRELSLNSAALTWADYQSGRLERFALRYAHLQRLSVTLDPSRLTVEALVRALAPTCTQLAHLAIAVNYGYRLEERTLLLVAPEVGQQPEQQPLSVMTCVKALSLEVVTTSHDDLERLRLGDHFPATQVFSLTHLFYLCEDCLKRQLVFLGILPAAGQQRPQLMYENLQKALHFLWEDAEQLPLTDALLRCCMSLVRARLFAALPRLKMIQANRTVAGLFQYYGTPTLMEETTFTREEHPTEDTLWFEMVAAKKATPLP